MCGEIDCGDLVDVVMKCYCVFFCDEVNIVKLLCCWLLMMFVIVIVCVCVVECVVMVLGNVGIVLVEIVVISFV